jgi:signal transduction histidine kinase
MGMIPSHEELDKLSDQDIIDRYNAAAHNTVVGTGFYRDEYIRRQAEKQAQQMLGINKNMQRMTIAITILTIVNVILVAYTIVAPVSN